MKFSKPAFITFGLGILLLLLSGLAIFTNHQGVALKLIMVVFWVLIVGTIFYINDQ